MSKRKKQKPDAENQPEVVDVTALKSEKEIGEQQGNAVDDVARDESLESESQKLQSEIRKAFDNLRREREQDTGASVIEDAVSPAEQEPKLEGGVEEAEDAEIMEISAEEPPPPVEQVKPILEALLFTTNDPLSLPRLSQVLSGFPVKELRDILRELQNEYAREGRGLQIVEVAGGFQIATRPEYGLWVTRFHRHKKRSPLSQATLETLAIVAYRQPVIRADIEAIRGVESSGVLRNLLDLGLVEVVGRKEVIGRPPFYGTTAAFLKLFGLRSISDLPSLAQLKEFYAQMQKENQKIAERAKPAPPQPEIVPEERESPEPTASEPVGEDDEPGPEEE
ncbi:MAG: SMC-Scp complex subunit ScpB [bacterium]